jgi:hypothetical protein
MYGNIQRPLSHSQTPTPHTAAEVKRHCFHTTSFSHPRNSSGVTTGQYISIFQILHTMILRHSNTGRIFTLLTGSTALRFTATDEPLAARRIQILPMNQYAC